MKFKTHFSFQCLAACLILVSSGTACVSARMSDHESDELFRQGNYEAAATRLSDGLKTQGEEGRDALLYLLDIGLAYHSAGRYVESNSAFLRADKIADIKDYTSLSSEGASLLTGENANDYKGEDFEKVLINTYLAMNYALLGDHENALVEARRVNQKLYKMVFEGKRNYNQNAFARYLSAILYEAENDFDDAYIDYKNTFKLVPHYPGLGLDLWRCAWKTHNQDDMDKWDATFHLSQTDHEQAKLPLKRLGKGEIIVLYENGISPVKRSNPHFQQVPKFYPRYNPVRAAAISVNGTERGLTATLENVEATAIRNLDEKYSGIVAKRIAGLVTKSAVAYGLEKATNNAFIGALAQAALFASDQADVRSWNLLPKELQVFRVVVDPGTYTVGALPLGAAPLPEKTVQVNPGEKKFVTFRYMP